MRKSWLGTHRGVCGWVAWAGVSGLLGAGSATAADGTWTNWAGGAWNVAANWQALTIPDGGTANLTGSGGSYAVRYDAVSPAIKNLNVWNAAPKTTDLAVSSRLTHLGGSALRLGTGARVAVTNGGVWTYTGVNNATDRGESMFSLRNGAEVVVCGGSVTFTNIVRSDTGKGNNVNVGYQSAGSLRVTSGRFDLWDNRAAPNVTHTLVVGRDSGGQGVMHVSGGTVTLGIQGSGETPFSVGSNGGAGTFTVSGGALVCTNTVANAVFFGLNGGPGLVIVTNTGFVAGANLQPWIGRGNKGRGLLTVAGGAATFGRTYAGYMDGSGVATGQVEVSGGRLTLTADGYFGYGQAGGSGRGTLRLGAGSMSAGSYYGLIAGYGKTGGSGSGALTLDGGSLTLSSALDGTYSSGLLIGYIVEADNNAASRAYGELRMNGGAVTNTGHIVVGANGATGTVVQTGGAIVQTQNANTYTAIGFGRHASSYFKGGSGRYELRGGTFLTRNRAFIGGVPTSVLASANPGSVGRLEVSGGSFICSNTVYVGANGSGTLVVGTNGQVRCDDLRLENATGSTLRFDVRAGWTGLVKVKNTVTVAAGARLEVDLSQYTGTGKAQYLLLDAAAGSGAFTPGDVTLTVPATYRASLDQLGDGDLRLTVSSSGGTAILLR